MDIIQIILNINKYILNPVIRISFALALIWFLWGGVLLLWYQQQGDGEKAKQYRKHLFWGIIGMFIAASVYGIMEIIANTIRSIGGSI